MRADQACYDVQHYSLRLDVDPGKQAIAGVLSMQADLVQASEVVALDLDAVLSVQTVKLDGKQVPFERPPGRIVVRDGSPAFGGDVHLASVEVTLEP